VSEFRQYKYETHTIKTEVFTKKDIEIHEEEVEKYKDDGWREVHTTIGYKGSMAIKRTLLERRTPLLQRGLRTECSSIDDACDIDITTILPYINAKKDDNLIFLIDTDEWDLSDAFKWFNKAAEVLDCGMAMFPKDMFCGATKITQEEYAVINNVLKRMIEK
jgi:hypothetical protein